MYACTTDGSSPGLRGWKDAGSHHSGKASSLWHAGLNTRRAARFRAQKRAAHGGTPHQPPGSSNLAERGACALACAAIFVSDEGGRIYIPRFVGKRPGIV